MITEPVTRDRILLGVSGGIAAYKACELIRLLRRDGHEVRVVPTPNALQFVSALTLQTLSGYPVRTELFSSTEESEISHIDLADWAEVVVVAPATASLIARLAFGQNGRECKKWQYQPGREYRPRFYSTACLKLLRHVDESDRCRLGSRR